MSLLPLQKKQSRQHRVWSAWGLITSLFLVVLVLEFTTHVDYVFGYLYTGPILISASRLGRRSTFYTTLLAVGLTILNLWVPAGEVVKSSTIASRIIAAIALIVTGILSDRNHQYEIAIAQQQVQLQSQEQLARVREDFASTLTHDLKTPLLGAIETLKAWEQGKFGTVTPTHYKILEKMIRSHQSTLQLVETLLDVYRNDTEGLQLQLAPVDLVAVAQAAIASFASRCAFLFSLTSFVSLHVECPLLPCGYSWLKMTNCFASV